jgi:uncharacterized protein with PIN domain
MRLAYFDTSCLVAIAFNETDGREMPKLLSRFDRLFSSNLLEAEWCATLVREHVPLGDDSLLAALTWVIPNRPLSPEIKRVLEVGYLRGADVWHLACALFLDPAARELSFVTLDSSQRAVAGALGFTTLPAQRSGRRPRAR